MTGKVLADHPLGPRGLPDVVGAVVELARPGQVPGDEQCHDGRDPDPDREPGMGCAPPPCGACQTPRTRHGSTLTPGNCGSECRWSRTARTDGSISRAARGRAEAA